LATRIAKAPGTKATAMQDLPPSGSARRRFALAVWVAVTALFAVLTAYALYAWIVAGRMFPWLAAIGGVGAFVGIWRWMHERQRGR
jgi:hypothetical protein